MNKLQKKTKDDQSNKEEEEKKIEWSEIEINEKIPKLISVESLEKCKFIPFDINKEYVNVAVVENLDFNSQNALRFFARKNKKNVKVFKITEDEFNLLLGKFKDPSSEISKAVSDFEEGEKEIELKRSSKGQREKFGVLKDAPVAKMVEVIIKNAIDGKASDIHIEPMDNSVRVRFRVDGVLYNSIVLPKKIGPAVISRTKILSNLKIDEKRKPQDGRFRIKDLGRTIDFRVSSLPTSYGEKIVMRILDTKSGLVKLDQLGIEGREREIIDRVIQEPHGIILVTGPTGSGKSTSLYSVLRILNKVGVNIITLEDPVEYVVEGINQSQVRPEIEYTFASGLRSILRQDPDVIMVGEIRDEETAELAIHAALTGHLVLSTLHTNSAIGAIARLTDMGIQPFLMASSLNLLMGQRLVRRICPKCGVEVKDIPKEALEMIEAEIRKIPEEALKRVEKNMTKENMQVKIFKGKGCNHCGNTGMKGRIGIYEMVEVNGKVSVLIGDKASESELEKMAREDGYTTMKQDGIIKVLQGMTTIEEVQRVTEDRSEEEVIGAKGENN